MKYLLVLVSFFCSFYISAQDIPKIKTITTYILKDTLGVDFNDLTSIDRWKRYFKEYDIEGRVIKNITYPFPFNPTSYIGKMEITKYVCDTFIQKVLTFDSQLVSEIICINKPNFRNCKSTNYGHLTSFEFIKYPFMDIILKEHDTLRNYSKEIRLSILAEKIDTTYITEGLIVKKRSVEQDSIDKLVTFEIFDTIRNGNLLQTGYVVKMNNEPKNAYHSQEITLNDQIKFRYSIYIDYEKEQTRKNDLIYQFGNIISKIEQNFENSEWKIRTIEKNIYNADRTKKINIRDDFSNGVFAYRFVYYDIYEYF
ncbi:MAG TPA: hypothetical protein VK169_14585 [Saprospiraceae bacterium]|nr:hypothetical protein [Saprospiraceae bacterium]